MMQMFYILIIVVVPKVIHLSKLIKLYTYKDYILLYINYNSIYQIFLNLKRDMQVHFFFKYCSPNKVTVMVQNYLL